ncbi:helix-turn-helix transcriptional regulator [Micromonospora echinofusca]|uniref:Helix-turn-helix domain-containing protein n=1 Tax=Micromonospora echinofusca TaxID=47858 RepID=A0ABS3VIV2_MICEH|nr:helix-turn-helix domain-containing protein [Micromonospora echinofusca]MBO4204451.1 helix-turn-helix domain-containing protein [Micromonospora echinofusca]
METPRTGPTGEVVDAARHRALGTASRARILELVRAADSGLTIAEVGERTGLHPSTARDHLDRLVDARLLVRARASGGQPERPAWRYRVITEETPAPAPYRALAAALLDHLSRRGRGDVRAEAARVGHDWGRHLAAATPPGGKPVDTLLAVLRGLGFNPALHPTADGGTEIHLSTCPFLELVARNPDAICGLHVGVLRGALEHAGAPPSDAVLEPFGAPTACVVRLSLPPGPPSDAPGGETTTN